MNGVTLAVVTIVVLFFFSIVLAAAETAFLRMSRVKAMALEEQGEKRATRLVRMLERPERTVNAVTLLALAAQLITSYLLGSLLGSSGWWIVVLSLVLNVIVFFVFAEAAPKTWAVQHTEQAALRTSGFLRFVTDFAPIRVIVRGLLGLVNAILPGKGLKKGPFVTEEEIRQMADVAADEAAIETSERELIHSIFEFGDTVVREVMVPRPDMIAVDADATVDEGIALAISAGTSRLPSHGAPRGRAASPCAAASARRTTCRSRSGWPSCCGRCRRRSSTWRSPSTSTEVPRAS